MFILYKTHSTIIRHSP